MSDSCGHSCSSDKPVVDARYRRVLIVALLLYRYRTGDSNMRSVWICSRNDAIGNIAVMCAAAGVWLTASAWPDVLVALAMAVLAITGALQIVRAAWHELHEERDHS